MSNISEIRKIAEEKGYEIERTATKMNGLIVYEVWKVTATARFFKGKYTLKKLREMF